MQRVNVAVAVEDGALGRVEEVAGACGALGFRHDSTLFSVGVITGSIESDRLRALRAVPGVVVVATEHSTRGAPYHGRG